MFSVQLSLDDQIWEPTESSMLPNPVHKPFKSSNNGPGNRTPTAEFNWPPANYMPLDPTPFPNYRTSYNFGAMHNQKTSQAHDIFINIINLLNKYIMYSISHTCLVIEAMLMNYVWIQNKS